MSRAPRRRLFIVGFFLLASALGGLTFTLGLGDTDSVSSIGSFLCATVSLGLYTTDRVIAAQAAGDGSVAALPVRSSWRSRFLDWLVGSSYRVERAERALRRAAGAGQQRALPAATSKATMSWAVEFRRATLLALRYQPAKARNWTTDPRLRPPDAELRRAFPPRQVRRLDELVASADLDVLFSVVDLARSLGAHTLEDRTLDRIADELSRTPETVLAAEFGRDTDRWRSFFERLPPERTFRSFEIALVRGRLREAAVLVKEPSQVERLASECLASLDIDVVDAGIDAATRLHDLAVVACLQLHAGEILDGESRRTDAVGRYAAALRACPPTGIETLLALVQPCLVAVHSWAERHEYVPAAEFVELLRTGLASGGQAGPAAEVDLVREALLAEARQWFGQRLRRTAEPSRPDVYLKWCRFEEAAGELATAARRAEDGGHVLKAHSLFSRATLYGEAVRVSQNDNSPEGLSLRAATRAAAGDLFAAAEDFRRAGAWQSAADNYLKVDAYAEAADCLRELHQDQAIEIQQFVETVRKLGDFDRLVRLCLQAIEDHGRHAAALRELRRLLREQKVGVALRAKVDETIRRVDGWIRQAFEARAQAWTQQAAEVVDKRFAPTWGLDLGTSTCMVAIYDTKQKRPVLCYWHHDAGFPSTLCIDSEGREMVGLRGEEIAFNRLRGEPISDTKRDMGTNMTYGGGLVGTYRPEEVAARLIAHGRMIVETMLVGQVREQIAEYSSTELGDFTEEWLDWALREHPVRLMRPRALVTIPAYYPIKAKNATRDACLIAGVDLVRLIHEPTAACIAATFERVQITGRVIIVDFGAGTLDISLLNVEDQFYEVRSLAGQTRLGSRDFDVQVAAALAQQLRRAGEVVPDTKEARHRLEVAAENLKIQLSSSSEAEVTLHAFNSHDVVVTLTSHDLESIIASSLAQLRQVCAAARPPEGADHLVLVGGPAHSPLVRRHIQEAFGDMPVKPVFEPRTAVAIGAALQAAVLDGKIDETLLTDVTPFSLGIKAISDKGNRHFGKLVEADARIPLSRSEVFSTDQDDQTNVHVEVYNGHLHPDSLIGQFSLDGIAPAPRGIPQIEITFAIDSSCVLTVTARDLGTGKTQNVRITDTTMLSPRETEDMRRRLDQVAAQQKLTTALREARRQLIDLLAETDGVGSGVDHLWEQVRRRIESLDPAIGSRLDAETALTLSEIRGRALMTNTRVRDTSERIDGARDQARRAANRKWGPALEAELVELAKHETVLRSAAEQMASLEGELLSWFHLLAQVETVASHAEVFRQRYARGDYRGALDVARTAGLTDPVDVERRRHALAEVRDVSAYRAAVADARATDPQLSRAAVDLAPAVTVSRVATPGGPVMTASGLLLAGDLVVTSREWIPGGGNVRVSVLGLPPVEGIAKPSAHSDSLIVVQLEAPLPVTVPRLGYSASLQVGDAVTLPTIAGDRYALRRGIIEQFLDMAAGHPATIRVSMQHIDPSLTGRLVRNDLDEIVGIVVATRHVPGQVTVVTADTLRLVRLEA
ncbi:Hsp70 family protein [Actinoplanes sp. NPDC026619]|uniref:Hsp70 family protein n=1 Tax=Actinoplanes sp. NPDC026619 TaxID=3155798 RepID=UPI0033F2D48D